MYFTDIARAPTHCLLCEVPAQSVPRAFFVGGVAASATSGALVAVGHRAGGAGLPFAAIGALLLHRTPSNGAVALVLVGVVTHVAMMFVWSLAFVLIVQRARYGVIRAALGVAAAQFVASWVAAWSTGEGLASVLPLGDRLVLAVVLVMALAVGMRVGFSPPQNA